MPHIMGEYLPHPPIPSPGVPVEPPPDNEAPEDPAPWIDVVLPPEEEKRPPEEEPEIIVVQPVVLPPKILPAPPDLTPPTIIPPVYVIPMPEPLPLPPGGVQPPVQPPPTLIVAGVITGLGTFMVYVGRKLVLTMAASLGTSLGKSAGAMLVGAVSKQLFRGTSLRFHTGQSYGLDPAYFGNKVNPMAASYVQAWRNLPQEFSYWEA